jgi:hypothetical protein
LTWQSIRSISSHHTALLHIQWPVSGRLWKRDWVLQVVRGPLLLCGASGGWRFLLSLMLLLLLFFILKLMMLLRRMILLLYCCESSVLSLLCAAFHVLPVPDRCRVVRYQRRDGRPHSAHAQERVRLYCWCSSHHFSHPVMVQISSTSTNGSLMSWFLRHDEKRKKPKNSLQKLGH